MEQVGYFSNLSYIFIPFAFENEDVFEKFNCALKDGGLWQPVKDEIRYMHRYVSERLTSDCENGTNLRHYHLHDHIAEKAGLYLSDRCNRTAPKTFKGEENVTFDFRITDVQLFSFNTFIGILAFQLQFESNDPLHIAAAQYYLRKISTEHIRVTASDGYTNSKADICSPKYRRFPNINGFTTRSTLLLLNEMFEDVQEPLSRLAEIQKQADEDWQRKYDTGINTALTTLSLLTIVSALTDASGITSNLDWLFPPIVSKIVQIVCILLVLSISIFMLVRLFFLKNRR